jgi:hypothetical protein
VEGKVCEVWLMVYDEKVVGNVLLVSKYFWGRCVVYGVVSRLLVVGV